MHAPYSKIELRDGRTGYIVDTLGPDYIVDVGESAEDWDTIIVKEDEIVKVK